eukprot:Pgem_evm1s4839
MGQSSYVAPAVFHLFEHMAIHCIDLPSLCMNADTHSASHEEALARIIREAVKKAPSIIYLPHLQ